MKVLGVGLVASAIASVGCATMDPDTELGQTQSELEQKERDLAALEQQVSDRERDLATSQDQIRRLESDLEQARLPGVSAAPTYVSASVGDGSGALLPPGAKPGECYARVYQPPKYETEEMQVLKKAASAKLNVIPAKYEWVEERVLVKDAYTTMEVVPATYEWKTEEILVKPAHTAWQKGRGPIERVDGSTGEIMCLKEVPAEYRTVKTRVVKDAEHTRALQHDAEYKTVKVRRLVEAARENRVEIPAEYSTITKRRQVADGQIAWRPVLCETNASRGTVTTIQRALKTAGHDPGPIDGVIGRETLQAVSTYQKEKGLASGGLTYATIDSLGVKVGR